MSYYTICKEVDIEVDLDDFDDDDLKEELDNRGYVTLRKEDKPEEDFKDEVFNLRRNYYSNTPDQFRIELMKFFRKHLTTNDY